MVRLFVIGYDLLLFEFSCKIVQLTSTSITYVYSFWQWHYPVPGVRTINSSYELNPSLHSLSTLNIWLSYAETANLSHHLTQTHYTWRRSIKSLDSSYLSSLLPHVTKTLLTSPPSPVSSIQEGISDPSRIPKPKSQREKLKHKTVTKYGLESRVNIQEYFWGLG